MTEDNEYALLGDAPVKEGNEKVDLLHFESHAKVLAGAAVQTEDPLTIGVFGPWGSGKTSLMRLIRDKVDVDHADNAVSVWFNAWRYEKEEHLIVPLVQTINKGLAPESISEKFKKLGRDMPKTFLEVFTPIVNALRAVAYSFSIKGKVGIPLISNAEVNLYGEKMVNRFQELAKDAALTSSMYFNAFEELDKCVKTHKAPRIVVFVDDLDRCLPDKAVELLEHIKLVLGQPGFSFVLGVYETIIQDVVRKKFEKDYGSIDPKIAEDYMHKIAQVQIHVPHRETKDLTDYIRNLLEKAGAEFTNDPTLMDNAIPLIAEVGKHNPRAILRFLNRIMVMRKIDQLDGNDYHLIAVIIREATSEHPRFCRSLDVGFKMGETETTVGQWLAGELGKDGADYQQWAESVESLAKSINSPSLNASIDTLKKNEHLFNLLKSDEGRKWLGDKEYRDMISVAQAQAVGSEKDTQTLPEPIQQLLNDMKDIPAGEFMMGSENGDSDEKPVHKVTLDAFKILATPVTQAQYEAVMGENPSYFQGGNNPVDSVSWDDAMEFCEKLSSMTGQKFRLPTEAEWECACRAGSKWKYCFGDDERQLDEYAWYKENPENKTHPVREKKPNAWGLYDMHGNVWEWCADWHGPYSADEQHNPKGPENGSSRVLRGGSWNNIPHGLRVSYRCNFDPSFRISYFGFRCSQ